MPNFVQRKSRHAAVDAGISLAGERFGANHRRIGRNHSVFALEDVAIQRNIMVKV
jgi:hypothetical protein